MEKNLVKILGKGKEWNMKKLIITAAALVMCLSQNVYAQTTADVRNDNGSIIINGNTSPNTAVMLTVKKTDDGKLYAVKETTSNDEGKFKFDFILKDEETDEEQYNYVLDIKGDGVFSENLRVFSADKIDSFTLSIQTGQGNTLYTLLEADTDDVLSNIGVLSEKYHQLGSDCENVCNAFYEDGGAANIAEIFNKEIILYTAKKSSDTVEYWSLMNDYFELSDISDFTKTRIFATKNYNNIKEFEAEVKKYELLNKINNAKYTELESLYNGNENVLLLSGCTEYTSYTSMTDLKRVVNEKVVTALLNNPAQEPANFLAAFKNAVTETLNSQYQGGGGGSTGGGGSYSGGKGSTTSSSTAVIVPNDAEITKPDKFNDVNSEFWAYESIEALADKEIINGYSDGSFMPNECITREGFVTILVNALKLLDSSSQCEFTDVESDKWYYKYVASGYSNGIVNGVSETEFGTGLNITRQDVAVMIYRALGVDGSGAEKAEFTDNDKISDYAKEAVYYLKSKGVISGRDDGSFDPAGNCTRAECAVMICRVLDLI